MKLLTPIFLLIAFTAFAQRGNIFTIDSLPTEGVLLDKGWKWHEGDNPDFAKADFDDSAWEGIDPTKDIFELPQLDKAVGQMGWFRIRLSLNAALRRQLAMQLNQSGASEIYLNGELIHRFGVISPNPAQIEAFTPNGSVLSFPRSTNPVQVLAVRYALQPHIRYGQHFGTQNPALSIRLNTVEQGAAVVNQQMVVERSSNIFVGALGILTILFLAFFLFFPVRKESLYFAIYALGQAISWSIFNRLHVLTPVGELFLRNNVFLIIQTISYLFLLQSVYTTLAQKRGWLFWGLMILGMVAIWCGIYAYGWGWYVFAIGVTTIVNLDATRVALVGTRKNQKGAWIIVVGGCVYLICWLFFQLIDLSIYLQPDLRGIFFLVSYLSIPVSFAIFFGYDFGLTNRILVQKLTEVETLSAEKQHILTTQNETLEKQVTERTAELVHKNRDLEIEAALEKVRAKSLEMQRSDELKEVVATLYEQLRHLGFQYGAACIFIIDKETNDLIQWVSGFNQSEYPIGYYIKYFNHPVWEAQFTAWKNGDKYIELLLAGEEKKVFDGYMFTQTDFKNFPEHGKAFMQSLPSVVFSLAFLKHGALQWGPEKLNDEQAKILQKFAVVFEQAYTRFLDLQKAEAQAREAEIEVALEKIRSRTLAMHKSDELKEVSALVREKLKELNVVLGTIAFWFFDKERMSSTFWVANEIQHEDLVSLPYDENIMKQDTCLKDSWEAVLSGKDIINKKYTNEQINIYFEYIFAHNSLTVVPANVREFVKQAECLTECLFIEKNSTLYADSWNGQSYSDEMISVLKRTAKVFEQAYVRFLDLQKAEAQAREAQIEVALERVRSRTMAMHKSDQLAGVMSVLCKEILNLGIHREDMETCYIATFEGNECAGEIYLTTSNGDIIPDSFRARYDEDYYFKQIYEAWKNGDSSLFLHGEGDELLKHFAFLYNSIPATSSIREMRAEDHRQLPYETFNYILYFSQGYLDVITRIPVPEYYEVFKRFGSTLQQAYTRFLDLQKAEAQAREAQIEAALERVRSRTMAMQKSEHLVEVINVVAEQLLQLNFRLNTASFFLNDESEEFTFWLAAIGESNPDKIVIPKLSHPVLNNIKEAQKNGVGFWADNLSFEEKNTWFQHVFAHSSGRVPEDRQKYILNTEGYARSVVLMKQIGLFIVNYVPQPYTDAENAIFKRFAFAFEQAYIRFLDLKKAEAQAREAQIEIALERVRSKTMAMQHSNQLREIAATTLEQLQSLGFTYGACSIVIMDAVSGDMVWWMSGFEKDYPTCYQNYYFEHPFYLAQLNNWKEGKKYAVMVCEGEDKKAYDKFIFSKTEFVKIPIELQKIMQAFEKITFSNAYMQHGALSWSTEPLDEEYAKILQRFAGVFEQSYTRFLDLQKAEAQTREAQIETALERVRSRTMAMQHSKELAETASLLFKQVIDLGVNAFAIVFQFWLEDGISTTCWASGGDGMQPSFRIPHTVEPFHYQIYKAWKRHEDFFVMETEGVELVEAYRFLIKQMGGKEVIDNIENSGFPIPKFQVTHCAFFLQGYIMFNTYERTPEAHDIFKRFGKVFEQTYTRFLDLQKAEAQAREAQIELALEKVRSKSMSMAKTDEISHITSLLFSELTQLDLEFNRSVIITFDKDLKGMVYWLAGPEGLLSKNGFHIPLFDHSLNQALIDNYKEKTEKWTFRLEGDNKKKWDDIAFVESDLQHLPDFIKESMINYGDMCFSMSSAGFGSLMIAGREPVNEAQFDIILRFSKVFDQTYTRFNDLKQAEAQAREAKIEASLERIRSRAMAMNTSDEFNAMIGFIYAECIKLNMHIDRGFIMTFDNNTNDAYWWIVSAEAPDMPMNFLVKHHEFAPSLAILKGWHNHEQKWSYLLEGTNKKTWDDYIFVETELSQLPELAKVNMRSAKSIILNASFQNFGCIMLSSFEPLSDEYFDLLVRLSKVFDLAYTRFLDLQLKEEQSVKISQEKQRLEAALKELQATQTQLIQKEKLASLGELTAGIAHEIQNPLNFVNNFSELSVDLAKDLNDEIHKPDIDKDYIEELLTDLTSNQEKINHHGKRASSIVKGMLEHSRTSTGVKELTDINKLADEYLRLSYHGMRAKDKDFNADFKTEFDENLPKIEVIPQDMGRVLLNLINNAFYAVKAPQPPKGENYVPTVIVSTQYLAPPLGAGGASIIIKVKDNGIGMPETTKAKVFQPFFTTKPTGSGTGLGLSLAYDIVTKGHGGTLEVESTEGVGSEFIISLPFKNDV